MIIRKHTSKQISIEIAFSPHSADNWYAQGSLRLVEMITTTILCPYFTHSNKFILSHLQANAYITIDLGRQYNVRSVTLWARPQTQNKFSKLLNRYLVTHKIRTDWHSYCWSTILAQCHQKITFWFVKRYEIYYPS